MMFGILKGFMEDNLLPVTALLLAVACSVYYMHYVDEAQPASADELKASFSKSRCVEIELREANEKGQVITRSMLENSSNRCKSVEDQRVVFDKPS